VLLHQRQATRDDKRRPNLICLAFW
jgi:hypothetical protein